jgi:hypothetical protein
MTDKNIYPYYPKGFERRYTLLKHFIKKLMPYFIRRKNIQKLYYLYTGKDLNWNNLKTYTEKMQWDKLYNVYEKKSECTDKIKVRDYVGEKIGEKYLIPIYGTWDSFNEIDFSRLPNQFVLKLNTGSGCNFIIRDKATLDLKKVKEIFKYYYSLNFAYQGYEMHYKKIKPRIIAEQLLEPEKMDIQDYKFMCFDGEPIFCWVDMDRHSGHKRNIYSLEWKLLDMKFGYPNSDEKVEKPEKFDEMIEVVKKLCHDFNHVRVDLYYADGRIYFGELTFTNMSGFTKIEPYEIDRKLGDLWELNIK